MMEDKSSFPEAVKKIGLVEFSTRALKEAM